MKFVDYFRALIHSAYEINWYQYNTSQRQIKDEKPRYPDASKEIRRRARLLEQARAEAKAEIGQGRVLRMRRAK